MQQYQHTASLPGKLGMYGLPLEVKYCKRCLASNQRPQSRREHEVSADQNVVETLVIGEDGLCDACRIDDQKKLIDWDARWEELERLCDEHRSTDGSFDCIVPGSGGKDSVFQTYILKDLLGMHPLTVTAPPTMPTDIGQQNFRAWTERFPNVSYKPSGEVHRLLTKLAFEKLQHPFQPWVVMQQNIGVRAANDHKVKLVFYGEHFADHGAGPIADTQTSLRNKSVYTYENIDKLKFGGVSVKELEDSYGVTLADLNLYMPVCDPGDVKVMYLGYYVPWSVRGNELFAMTRGFSPSPMRTSGSYTFGSSIDDGIDTAHYYTAAMKFGSGRAAFNACQDIRAGVITRTLGIELVKEYDLEPPQNIAEVCDYLGISDRRFYYLCDISRASHLWHKVNGEWVPKHPVWETTETD